MSRLILQMQTSIDGYVDSELPDSRWQAWNWGPDWPWSAGLRSFFNRVFAQASGILLSRPMVDEGYLDHWRATAERHPGEPDYDFARAIGALPRFAVSRSGEPERHWPNLTVLNGDLAGIVGRAKERAGGDVLCFGGAGLANALVRADLVDELQLFINPGFAGGGRRIFDESMATRHYRAADAEAYPCGIVVTRWAKPA
ncbi:dihydrofolate reductase family protein [Rugosimonospora africana]|uniref:Deaminase n=1 Tax=Rugosimonospora africana TaxID=556532 RepID=A0A8J3VSC7_9ACTN|nr:dihydrofolate reductase family protein [Rugosimonospora africana]GIH17110.1 deaminase [Rugosimonospora africana]